MPIMDMLPKGDTLQIPLDAPTSLAATAGNAQVELTWTDPKDKYATPEGEVSETGDQLVSEWDHTVLVRKTGSQPAGPNDGTVVVSSSVRNQYQTTPYTDSGLTNDTLYYYGVFAYNKDGVASAGAFVNATPIAGTPVSSLAVGTLIKIKENGAPVEYMVVNQGLPSSMYDASCNGCWLVRKDIATNRAWDSTNSDYKNSDIQAYLNGGWTSRYEAEILSKIKQVKIPYVNDPDSGQVSSGANGLSCKFFLLGDYEVGWTSDDGQGVPKDGAKLSYFGSGGGGNTKRIANYNGRATTWWLRTSSSYYDNRVWYVNTNGRLYSDQYYSNCGLRPACILPSDALVTEELELVEG